MTQNKTAQGQLHSAIGAVSVISNSLTTYDRCRSVYIGNSQSLDFSYDGSTWVTYPGLVAGAVYDFEVLAARVTAGGGAPAAGDVVFQY